MKLKKKKHRLKETNDAIKEFTTFFNKLMLIAFLILLGSKFFKSLDVPWWLIGIPLLINVIIGEFRRNRENHLIQKMAMDKYKLDQKILNRGKEILEEEKEKK